MTQTQCRAFSKNYLKTRKCVCFTYHNVLNKQGSGLSLTKLDKPTHPQRTFSLWSLVVLWLQSEVRQGFGFLGKSWPSPGTLEEPVSWLLAPVVSQSVPSYFTCTCHLSSAFLSPHGASLSRVLSSILTVADSILQTRKLGLRVSFYSFRIAQQNKCVKFIHMLSFLQRLGPGCLLYPPLSPKTAQQ